MSRASFRPTFLLLKLQELDELDRGALVANANDHREQKFGAGPLSSIGIALSQACEMMFIKHEREFRNVQSPQQAMLTENWSRLRETEDRGTEIAEAGLGCGQNNRRTLRRISPRLVLKDMSHVISALRR